MPELTTEQIQDLFGHKAANQETDPAFNREPGIAVIPGSPYAKYMAQFESHPFGGFPAGNPYTYKPFPKMVYKAFRYNGAPACMAAPPDPFDYPNPAQCERVQAAVEQFNRKCQLIVNDEKEYQKARENGWCEGPAEALEWLKERDRTISLLDTHREYEDRNMSEAAKAEVKAQMDEVGGDPIPEKIADKKPPKPTYRKTYR